VYGRPLVDADDPLVPLPAAGRVFRRSRRVRLGDASPGGRLRLDALARYLQDVANDDTRDVALPDETAWVVRRTVIDVHRFPRFGEGLELATFCGGIGPRWAERRVSVHGDQGSHAEAATLWVHLDLATGRPKSLPAAFAAAFAEAAQGRTVRARLYHGDPPIDGPLPRPWPVRFVDFDVLGHMNNAAYWAIVEEELARRRDLRAPMRCELEFRQPVAQGQALYAVCLDGDDGSLALWLVNDAVVHASACVRPWAG
jgi:acyl-ACP thioesterase